MNLNSGYSHTQKSPPCLILYGTAIALIVGAWFSQDQFPIAVILGGSGVLTLFLATAFHHLTVEDQGEGLSIRFGPLFRKTVRYDDIEKIEIGRTTILEGWGIHHSNRGGWVWNIGTAS